MHTDIRYVTEKIITAVLTSHYSGGTGIACTGVYLRFSFYINQQVFRDRAVGSTVGHSRNYDYSKVNFNHIICKRHKPPFQY